MEVDTALITAIICLLIILFLTVVWYLIYCGLLADIDIKATKPPFDALTVSYKFGRGPYKKCGELFSEVHSLVPKLKCIGIYYDCPDEVDSASIRYIVGAILDDKKAAATQEMKDLLLKEGFQTVSFPAIDHAVITSFPFKGAVSIMLAIVRVYPKLRQYLKERKLCAHPIMEIYSEDEIIFLAPLAKQDEFYVNEALEESEEETSTDHRMQADSDVSKTTVNEDPKEQGSEKVSNPSAVETASRSNSVEFISHIDIPGENGNNAANGSDRSTASSFEELQMDS